MTCINGIILDIKNKVSFPGSVCFENGKIKSIKKMELDQLLTDKIQTKLPYILPGFIDSHLHLDMTQVSPAEFARIAFTQGVTGAAVDCHDSSAVLGKKGVLDLIENAGKSSFNFGFSAPANICKNVYELEDVEELLKLPQVTHLGEMKDFPALILHEEEPQKLFALSAKYGKPADGHGPGVTRLNLIEYCKSPVSTDHEVRSYEDGVEKIEAGLKVQIQTRDNVNFLSMKNLVDRYPDKTMLCSEIVFCHSIRRTGYINKAVEQLVENGCNIWNVLKAACINPVEHYKLDCGLLREGDNADFIVVENTTSFKVLKTYVKGQCVFDIDNEQTECDHNLLAPASNVSAGKITEEDLIVECSQDEVNLNVIDAMDDEMNTVRTVFTVKPKDKKICSDTQKDILKVINLSRIKGQKPAVAFVHGFGIKKGAFAMSINHEAHNFCCVGADDSDMVIALNRLIDIKGGLVYVADGKVIAEVPFEYGGLISTKTAEELKADFESTRHAMRTVMGCTIRHPIHTLSYLFDTTVPTLKLSQKGLFSVAEQEVINLYN